MQFNRNWPHKRIEIGRLRTQFQYFGANFADRWPCWTDACLIKVLFAFKIVLGALKWPLKGGSRNSRFDCTFDWELPSSLSCATRFEHQFHLPEVTLVLWLIASHTWVAHAKQASCFLHRLSVFTRVVPLFYFLHSNKTVNMITTGLFHPKL